MPLVVKDRVKETTTTTGTGTITLAGASTGYQSFSAIGNGNTTYYCIAGQTTSEWEVGIGTYTSAGTTLSRDTVLASSNAGSLVTFSAGTKDVFVTYPSGRAVLVDGTTIDAYGMGATQGDIIYASATDTFSRLAKDATATRYLSNTGASNNPAWAQVNLANGVTGTLPTANGGTGNTSGQAASVANAATFNNGGTGAASGTTFNGSSAVTVSYNTIGAPSTTGTNASGTWGISVTGSAGSVVWTNVSGRPSTIAGLLGADSIDANPNTRLGSGYYQQSTTTTANGWPVNGSWYHLHSVTHSNTANYYAMQFAADFFGQTLYYRSTNNSGLTAWSQVLLSTSTGANQQFNSFGVGTAASGTAGEIRATNNITAYYSDERLKTRLGAIENALDKLCSLDGFYYQANEIAQSLGYEPKREVGVSAQQVQTVMPEVVAPAPIDDKYLTVRYEKLVPLLIEAIKELSAKVDELKKVG